MYKHTVHFLEFWINSDAVIINYISYVLKFEFLSHIPNLHSISRITGMRSAVGLQLFCVCEVLYSKLAPEIFRSALGVIMGTTCCKFNKLSILPVEWIYAFHIIFYTGCPRRNVQYFGRVFLMLNYTDITQNTCIQSWTVTEIMAREKCGLLGCPRTVRRPWRHTHPMRMPGNESS